jgi:ribonuclease HII
MDIYRHDDDFRRNGYLIIAGTDEAGRGPIAGPVVAATVVLPSSTRIKGLRDSKKIPEKEREHLFWEVLASAEDIGIGISDNNQIDNTDILKATKSAMRSSVEDLINNPDCLIVDAVTIPNLTIKQFPVIKADAKSASVAAASIIAKYVRDRLMIHFDSLYPQYNFAKHKGYCTREHMERVAKYGPCPIHRISFRQVLEQELPFSLS